MDIMEINYPLSECCLRFPRFVDILEQLSCSNHSNRIPSYDFCTGFLEGLFASGSITQLEHSSYLCALTVFVRDSLFGGSSNV